jgi:PPP family 3-phenylpropionic acid transporter
MSVQEHFTASSLDYFPLRLALFYSVLLIVMGIQVPFLPLWCKAKGLDAEAIGVVLAVPIGVRLFAVPVINRVADRWGELRAALVVCSFMSILGFVAVGFSVSFATIVLTIAIAALFFTPIGGLVDAYALKGLESRKQSYGRVRLWGSVAFLVANVCAGFLLSVFAAEYLIWLIVAALAAMSATSIILLPVKTVRAESAADYSIRRYLWRSPRFLIVAAAASCIQSSHAIYYVFSAVIWTTKGFGSVTVGTLWATGVAAEIILFAVSGRFALRPATWIALGAAGAFLRWAAMSLDPPAPLLLVLQCLHAFSFGATHLGSVQFASQSAYPGQVATAQGDFGTVIALAAVISTGCSGVLYNSLGEQAYLVMAVLAVVAALLLVLGVRLPHRL